MSLSRDLRNLKDAHRQMLHPSVQAFGPRMIPQPGPSYTLIVEVTNKGTDDWTDLDIVAVSAPRGASSDPREWSYSQVLYGTRLDGSASLDESDGYPILGITQEPIAQGATGRVCVRGVTPAKVQRCPSGYTDLGNLEWAHVWKIAASGGNPARWTLRFGPAGDAKILKFISYDISHGIQLYTSDEYLVLIDLCEVPNRFWARKGSGGPVPAHSICKGVWNRTPIELAPISPQTTSNGGYPAYTAWDKVGSFGDVFISPGWEMPEYSNGWCYRVVEEQPVCVATAVEYNYSSAWEPTGPWGPACDSGYSVWPGLPGFSIFGKSYFKSGSPPYYHWMVKDLSIPFYAKADGNQRGSTGYLSTNGLWAVTRQQGGYIYNGTVQDGISWPTVKALLGAPGLGSDNLIAYYGPSSSQKVKEINVQDGQIVEVNVKDRVRDTFYGGAAVFDDPIGTVKMYNRNDGFIPAGWRVYAAMQERFPAGVKSGSTWVSSVGATGGNLTHTHSTTSGSGTGTGSVAQAAANHLPPYSGIIFIERYQ